MSVFCCCGFMMAMRIKILMIFVLRMVFTGQKQANTQQKINYKN
jgi:hypothetical protein